VLVKETRKEIKEKNYVKNVMFLKFQGIIKSLQENL